MSLLKTNQFYQQHISYFHGSVPSSPFKIPLTSKSTSFIMGQIPLSTSVGIRRQLAFAHIVSHLENKNENAKEDKNY